MNLFLRIFLILLYSSPFILAGDELPARENSISSSGVRIHQAWPEKEYEACLTQALATPKEEKINVNIFNRLVDLSIREQRIPTAEVINFLASNCDVTCSSQLQALYAMSPTCAQDIRRNSITILTHRSADCDYAIRQTAQILLTKLSLYFDGKLPANQPEWWHCISCCCPAPISIDLPLNEGWLTLLEAPERAHDWVIAVLKGKVTDSRILSLDHEFFSTVRDKVMPRLTKSFNDKEFQKRLKNFKINVLVKAEEQYEERKRKSDIDDIKVGTTRGASVDVRSLRPDAPRPPLPSSVEESEPVALLSFAPRASPPSSVEDDEPVALLSLSSDARSLSRLAASMPPLPLSIEGNEPMRPLSPTPPSPLLIKVTPSS